VNIRDPKTQKFLMLGLVVAAVNYCYFLVGGIPFAYKAKATEIKQLQGEYGKLSTEINQARRLAADLQRVEKLHAVTQRKWEIATELLPPRTDMAGLLRSITLAGHTSGVEFVGFEPEDSRNQEYYAENPVKVTVVGSYHGVGAFLSQIAELPRLVTVRMPKLVALKGGDEGETVTAEFVASAYSVTGDHVRAKASGSRQPKSGGHAEGDQKKGPGKTSGKDTKPDAGDHKPAASEE